MIPNISNQLVDASEAGEGSLEILVKSTANGQPSLPTHVESLGNAVFNVSFTPDTSIDHLIQVTFNDDHIPGKEKNNTNTTTKFHPRSGHITIKDFD